MLEVQARPTPLHARHLALGGTLIEFAGWLLPVQYEGILREHRAVRERAGLFDLCHMGELHVEGREAADALAYALVTDSPRLADGQAQYSMICASDGGIIDDLIVYRLGAGHFLVVANGANVDAVRAAISDRLRGFDARLVDRTLETALIAIQGPRAQEILRAATDVDLAALRYYRIAHGSVMDIEAMVARTGYTGEDGFELFVPVDRAGEVWDRLLELGQPFGIAPVGLGARDTLRLEAAMPLYGNELDRTTTPFDVGLGRVVHLDRRGDFVGREALVAAAAHQPSRALAGLVVRGHGIARHGYPVMAGGQRTGTITSGTHSPSLGVPIALASVSPEAATVGRTLDVEIRERPVAAEVVRLPFYKRSK